MSKYVKDAEKIVQAAGYDLIILETSGIGQSDTEIIDHSDLSLYVMTPEYGAATQLEKIDMLDFADLVALNKFDKRGALDALRDVKKQYQRNHLFWDKSVDEMPVYGTIASQFNDPGVNKLFNALMITIKDKTGVEFISRLEEDEEEPEKIFIIPPNRTRYLSEISETVRGYNHWTDEQANVAQRLYALHETIKALEEKEKPDKRLISLLGEEYRQTEMDLDGHNNALLEKWEEKEKEFFRRA
jgi:methylmalonyl-CoA mutase